MKDRSGPDVGIRLAPVSHTRFWSNSTVLFVLCTASSRVSSRLSGTPEARGGRSPIQKRFFRTRTRRRRLFFSSRSERPPAGGPGKLGRNPIRGGRGTRKQSDAACQRGGISTR